MASIRCGHCGQKHESVAAVQRCSRTGGQAASSRVVQPVTVAKPGPATVGMYRKLGQIYKVDFWGATGRLYAKRLDKDVDSEGKTTFRYVTAAGMATRLTQADRMDPDEAKAFGHLTGVCIRCATVLWDPKSVAAGIGPVCATKL
jgi:hypothetical protein